MSEQGAPAAIIPTEWTVPRLLLTIEDAAALEEKASERELVPLDPLVSEIVQLYPKLNGDGKARINDAILKALDDCNEHYRTETLLTLIALSIHLRLNDAIRRLALLLRPPTRSANATAALFKSVDKGPVQDTAWNALLALWNSQEAQYELIKFWNDGLSARQNMSIAVRLLNEELIPFYEVIDTIFETPMLEVCGGATVIAAAFAPPHISLELWAAKMCELEWLDSPASRFFDAMFIRESSPLCIVWAPTRDSDSEGGWAIVTRAVVMAYAEKRITEFLGLHPCIVRTRSSDRFTLIDEFEQKLTEAGEVSGKILDRVRVVPFRRPAEGPSNDASGPDASGPNEST